MRRHLKRYKGKHRRDPVGTYTRKAAFTVLEWWALPDGTRIPPTDIVDVPSTDPWCRIPLYVWGRTKERHANTVVSVLLFMVR